MIFSVPTSGQRSRRDKGAGRRHKTATASNKLDHTAATASPSSDAGALADLQEERLVQRLSPEEWVVAALLAVLVVLNFTGIVSRYWIHISLPWIEEVEVALLMWVVFLGAGLTVVRNLHLGFAPIVEQLPRRIRALLRQAGVGVFALFFVVLLWFGIRMVLDEASYDQRTPTLAWPEWWISLAIPVGAALALVRIALRSLLKRGR